MKNKILNKNLERTIKLKLIDSNINDIEKIEQISIQNRNLTGSYLDIDIKEFAVLKNIKSLSLKYFQIDDEAIETFNKLEYLTNLEFLMCDFKTSEQIKQQQKSCIIYCCENFKIDILENQKELEYLALDSSGMVEIEKIKKHQNLKILKISNCNVINFTNVKDMINLERLYLNDIDIKYDLDISNMKRLKFISLSGSKVANKEEYLKNLLAQKPDIEIEFRESSLPLE